MNKRKWETFDESMLYPEGKDAISYLILRLDGTPEQIKMILFCSAPESTPELQALRELADQEYSDITGCWAGQLANMIDGGRITFDLVFANELIDSRKANRQVQQ